MGKLLLSAQCPQVFSASLGANAGWEKPPAAPAAVPCSSPRASSPQPSKLQLSQFISLSQGTSEPLQSGTAGTVGRFPHFNLFPGWQRTPGATEQRGGTCLLLLLFPARAKQKQLWSPTLPAAGDSGRQAGQGVNRREWNVLPRTEGREQVPRVEAGIWGHKEKSSPLLLHRGPKTGVENLCHCTSSGFTPDRV